MADFSDLKTRIISEMHREDLEDEYATNLLQHVKRAVEKYADEQFWFNRARASASTVNGTATVALPATIRRAERVFVSTELDKMALEEIPQTQDANVPLRWAAYGDSVWLDPVPDGIYTVTFTGIAQVDAPQADADDNIWTNEAADLIAAQTKGTLYLALFHDQQSAAAEFTLAADILRELKQDTRRREKSPMRFQKGLLPVRGVIVR